MFPALYLSGERLQKGLAPQPGEATMLRMLAKRTETPTAGHVSWTARRRGLQLCMSSRGDIWSSKREAHVDLMDIEGTFREVGEKGPIR